MVTDVLVDEMSGRKYTIDEPEQVGPGQPITVLLSLHGGGSVGAWQREYFPAHLLVDSHRLVVITPSAATRTPFRHWVADADDAHLRALVETTVTRYGAGAIRALWLVGHSQGGMTSHRLLQDPWWRDRVDGWLSLSGGRFGPPELPDDFFGPHRHEAAERARARGEDPGAAPFRRMEIPGGGTRAGDEVPDGLDISFVFATGEHEIVELPERSPLAEAYGGGARHRVADVVDDQPGRIHDTTREEYSTPAWGLAPAPGRAEIHVYPGLRDGRLVADVVRIDKGHTEGLEPEITRRLVELATAAPGGKLAALG